MLKNGTFKVNQAKLARWKEKVLNDDPAAKFDPSNLHLVRHSICGRDILVKEMYDATRWRKHIEDCVPTKRRKIDPTAGMPTLPDMASKFGWKMTKIEKPTKEPAPKIQPLACPGLTEVDNRLVPIYIQRTGAKGGGSQSVTVIAKDRFGKKFSKLNQKKQRQVLDLQEHEQTWRNDHGNSRVFSVTCIHYVSPAHQGGLVRPYEPCIALLRDRRFQSVLQKPLPNDSNYIYNNHRFRNQVLGELYARTIGLREIIESPVSNGVDNHGVLIVYF